MKNTTASRLQQIMSERNLKQVDIISLSKAHQKELGVKLGKSALSQYINGKSTPDQEKLVLLARTLGVSEAWLMGYDAPVTDNPAIAKDDTIAGYTSGDLRKMAENAKTFDGKPLTEEDIDAIQNIIEIYLRGR